MCIPNLCLEQNIKENNILCHNTSFRGRVELQVALICERNKCVNTVNIYKPPAYNRAYLQELQGLQGKTLEKLKLVHKKHLSQLHFKKNKDAVIYI